MTDNSPDDPFAGLPDELRKMLEAAGGQDFLAQLQAQFQTMMSSTDSGPVNWDLARQVALQIATESDRPPTDDERLRAANASSLAEYWLDATDLPMVAEGARTVVGSREEWVVAALDGLRGFVEPVAQASIDAMQSLAGDSGGFGSMGQGEDIASALEGLPPALRDMLGGIDLGAVIGPMGAALTGLQTGQVVGNLATQMFGQYDLGIPTASPQVAQQLAVNVTEAFDGYDLDMTQVALVIALHEAAHRRLYHAVAWLPGHLAGLVAQFAALAEVDPRQLMDLSQELMSGVDPEDPDQLRQAMERASSFRMEPTTGQKRVLQRLQGVVLLVQATVRRAVAQAVADRLDQHARIEEVLRRRRATKGDGEALLEQLLGLDLKPEDETLGDRFIDDVQGARGPEGLQRAWAHPENLPDADELADATRWLVRMAAGEQVPDDPSALFGDSDAPVEPSAEQRLAGAQTAGPDDEPEDEPDDEPGDAEQADDESGEDPQPTS